MQPGPASPAAPVLNPQPQGLSPGSSLTPACPRRKHTARLPPDLIWLEWFNGRRPELRALTRGRPLAVYRANLLDHIGSHSSFAVRATRPKWPGCFDSMAGVWSLHKTERFQVLPAGLGRLLPAGCCLMCAASWVLPLGWLTRAPLCVHTAMHAVGGCMNVPSGTWTAGAVWRLLLPFLQPPVDGWPVMGQTCSSKAVSRLCRQLPDKTGLAAYCSNIGQ